MDSHEEIAARRAAGLAAAIARASGVALTLQVRDGAHRAVAADGIEALLGHTAEQCRSWPDFWRAIVHPDDVERVVGGVARPGALSARLRRHDGSYVAVDIHAATLPDAPDLVHAVLLESTDASKLAADNRELSLRERMLRQRLDGFVSNIPGIAWESYFEQSVETMTVDWVSEMLEPLSGYTVEQWKQPNFWLELVHPEDRPGAMADAQAVFHGQRGSSSYRWITRDGRTLWVTSRMSLIFGEDGGAPIGLRGVTMDETSVKQAEAQRAEVRMREEIIRAQDATLLALSTPLIPIDDDIVVIPLVGALDPRRIERVQETLLEGVVSTRARTVILDMTGVPEIDAEGADALIRATRAVGLLGAEAVITGLRPEVAAAVVALGTNLRGIVTLRTLKAGIAYAMNRQSL